MPNRPPFKVTTREKEVQRLAVNRLRDAIVRLIDGGADQMDELLTQMLVGRFAVETGEEWIERELARYLLAPESWSHESRIQLGTDLLNVAFMLDPQQAPELVQAGLYAVREVREVPPGVNPGPRRRRASAGAARNPPISKLSIACDRDWAHWAELAHIATARADEGDIDEKQPVAKRESHRERPSLRGASYTARWEALLEWMGNRTVRMEEIVEYLAPLSRVGAYCVMRELLKKGLVEQVAVKRRARGKTPMGWRVAR